MTTAEYDNQQPRRRARLGLLVLVAMVLLGTYYVASPYITLYRAGQAIDRGDSQYVCDHIDFETLRGNLEEAAPAGDSMLVRSLVSSGVSCETVESGMSMAEMFGGDESDEEGGIFSNVETGFEGPATFSVNFAEAGQNGIELVLTRAPLTWELTDVRWGESADGPTRE